MREHGMRLAIFGSIDGLVMFMGLVIGLLISHQSDTAAWHAAIGGSMGEMIGMTAGQYESDSKSGLRVAIACGFAGMIACAAPAIPFMFLPRMWAVVVAFLIALAITCAIIWIRPQRTVAAAVRTFGILAAASLLSGLTGLI